VFTVETTEKARKISDPRFFAGVEAVLAAETAEIAENDQNRVSTSKDAKKQAAAGMAKTRLCAAAGLSSSAPLEDTAGRASRATVLGSCC